jgi:hypothetical protein
VPYRCINGIPEPGGLENIPTEKPRLARTTFPDPFEVERLISKEIIKNEVTFCSIV